MTRGFPSYLGLRLGVWALVSPSTWPMLSLSTPLPLSLVMRFNYDAASEQGRVKRGKRRGVLPETRNCQRDEEVQRQINRINKSHGFLIKTEPAKQQKRWQPQPVPSVVTKRVVRVVPGRSFPCRFAWQSDERGPRWEGVEAPLIIKTFWQLAEFVRLLVRSLSLN